MAIHRRQFIETTLGAAAAVGLASAARGAATKAAGDIRVGQIGFNSRGSEHIKSLGKNVVALCDVDQRVLKAKADELKKHDQTVDTFTDYRKLLDDKNIDAVSIATPNHTHALIAIAAMQAGKDVYVEKPVCHNIWEGRQLVAAAQRYDRIVQAGTQSRSSQSLKDASAWVRAGNLGAIRYALATCYKPRPSIGKSDTALQFPDFIDRDLWIGPAADQPIYRPEKNSVGKYNPHYDWHWDYNTGCGDLGNQGIHQMDIARWFLGEQALAPRTLSLGGRVGYDDAGNTANTQVVLHAYENAPLVFEVRGLPRDQKLAEQHWDMGEMDTFRGTRIGVIVQCEKGYVLIPNYTEAIAYDNKGDVVKKWSVKEPAHHANWLEAVSAHDRKLLNADIREGFLSSALCHTANASHRVGKPAKAPDIGEQIRGYEPLSVAFDRMCGHLRANGVDVDAEPVLTMGEWLSVDPKTETFINSDAATKLRTREYRKPFVVPDVEREMAGQSAAAG